MDTIAIGLAFFEGMALIASPCILPVLPLVLATSVGSRRGRPYGIIIGFVLAFSLFAIVARKIVSLLGIDLDLLRDVSLVLLALFGLALIFSNLSARFSALTQGLANFGNSFASSNSGGLRSGILVGSLIGLVWTPCAGPILAAVLVQVIRQQSDVSGDLIIVSFAMGAGLPMLAIAVAGRTVMSKLAFFAQRARYVQQALGMLILASVALIASGVDAQSLFSPAMKGEETHGNQVLQNALPRPYAAPEFAGIESWFNSQPLTMSSLKGKVVLVDFWTYSCINCIRTLPYVTAWDRKYRDLGLVIVGVHSAEFEFEKKQDNVKAALVQYGIRYPVALDNHLDTWSNFKNRYWPAHYLIDRDGKIVYTHAGEGAYDITEHNIRHLLGLGGDVPPAQANESGSSPEHLLSTSTTQLKNNASGNAASISVGGKIFKDCSDCPEMVAIPAGSFDMGSGNGEANEKPVHRVTLSKPFAIGRTEVTQGQWKAIMGKDPGWFRSCGDDCPVEQVRWAETQLFIQKLNVRTRQNYRLPSEAEWEYSCRAGGQQEYCGSDNADNVAWYNGNSGMTTHPAAGKQANAFGLYDMSGNVWEWVEDTWHDNYNGAPVDGSAWSGASSKRVLRGGSWIAEAQGERAARRDWNEFTARIGTGGFRLARSLPQ